MTILTIIHVAISLVAILAGFVVLVGMLRGKRLDKWTANFLAMTVATSVTGFLFPFHGFTPAVGTGIISLVVLAVAIYARYGRRLVGAWRKTYVINAVLALYLNVFVLVVQLFLKVPALKAMAPTQSEPPFKITQLILLVTFVLFGIAATIRFRAEPIPASPALSTSPLV